MAISKIKIHNEETFEFHVVDLLCQQQGFVLRECDRHYDKATALDPELVIEFIKATQPEDWKSYSSKLGDKAPQFFIQELVRRLAASGTHEVLKSGIKFATGGKFKLSFPKPASSINPKREQEYGANILSVMRQVKYSAKNNNAIDTVLFLNGIPVATVEFKNELTGQTVQDAIKQYRYDRKPAGEPLLLPKRGALVHLAVDTNSAYMTTKLENGKTEFLPLNRGNAGHEGNTPVGNEFPVAHLYTAVDGREAIFSREILLDIIHNFIVDDGKLIFPRYHQISAVRSMAADAVEKGAGQNYLIQHSAGSGKTWTIAWTAAALAKLHNDSDDNVFDTVIIVSDRKVLDSQLQKAIRKLGLTDSYFEAVDQTSRQLRDALVKGKKLVVTTIQKFCTDVIADITKMPGKKFAVIIDEAHGSQSGKAAQSLQTTLSNGNEVNDGEDAFDAVDAVTAAIERMQKGRQPSSHVSYVAFTATPKNVTLERFGTRENTYEKPRPFHLYTMRQAIEEGFILDVLQNYTTYKSFYELEKTTAEDPRFKTREARRKIARYVQLSTVDQKAPVIVEHFRAYVQHQLGGKAKAMIVTQSREHAYRHFRAIEGYIKDRGYSDLHALVAFSGDLYVDGHKHTEPELNGFSETELPAQFDGDGYQVLIVANKYQTGFDQPKICAMYVDRTLKGLQCVQTLSRANRTCKDKTSESVYVLDFQNRIDDITDAFMPYYDATTLDGLTDPNQIYDILSKIERAGFIPGSAIDDFAEAYFKPNLTSHDRIRLEGLVNATVANFKLAGLPEQEEFRQAVKSFCRFYTFVAQVFEVGDVDLERAFSYLEWLSKKLQIDRKSDDKKLSEELFDIRKFRIEKKEEGSAAPEIGETKDLKAIGRFGINAPILEEEEEELSKIITSFNEKYGTEFSDDDVSRYSHHAAVFVQDERIQQMILNNPDDVVIDQFSDGLLDYLMDKAAHEKEMDSIMFSDPDNWKKLAYFLLRINKRASL